MGRRRVAMPLLREDPLDSQTKCDTGYIRDRHGNEYSHLSLSGCSAPSEVLAKDMWVKPLAGGVP